MSEHGGWMEEFVSKEEMNGRGSLRGSHEIFTRGLPRVQPSLQFLPPFSAAPLLSVSPSLPFLCFSIHLFRSARALPPILFILLFFFFFLSFSFPFFTPSAAFEFFFFISFPSLPALPNNNTTILIIIIIITTITTIFFF